ncbi:MAG: hypothetical protein KBB83_02175 [Alphaproteobacteria bacterium]|nr:hypothetical protein [Alphaproteobacteria bacterium]
MVSNIKLKLILASLLTLYVPAASASEESDYDSYSNLRSSFDFDEDEFLDSEERQPTRKRRPVRDVFPPANLKKIATKPPLALKIKLVLQPKEQEKKSFLDIHTYRFLFQNLIPKYLRLNDQLRLRATCKTINGYMEDFYKSRCLFVEPIITSHDISLVKSTWFITYVLRTELSFAIQIFNLKDVNADQQDYRALLYKGERKLLKHKHRTPLLYNILAFSIASHVQAAECYFDVKGLRGKKKLHTKVETSFAQPYQFQKQQENIQNIAKEYNYEYKEPQDISTLYERFVHTLETRLILIFEAPLLCGDFEWQKSTPLKESDAEIKTKFRIKELLHNLFFYKKHNQETPYRSLDYIISLCRYLVKDDSQKAEFLKGAIEKTEFKFRFNKATTNPDDILKYRYPAGHNKLAKLSDFILSNLR